jgi:hypothetical protein
VPIVPSAVTLPPSEPPAAATRRDGRADLLGVAAALALAVWVTSGLWRDPEQRTILVNSSDHAFFEWILAYGAHALTHGENPLFTHLVNVPDGVNLAVNTSITAYAAAFAPLTYAVGPPATFLLILTVNLAATAVAWYWLLSRHVVRSPLAAIVGGLFIAFAPAMISHANAHLNWTAGWLVPLIVWRVLCLRRPTRWLPNAMMLGVLVAVAFSIAAEGLFLTALAIAVFLTTWALSPETRAEAAADAPVFLRGLTVAAAVAVALLSYPLWLHFFGPQRFHGTGFDPVIHSEDIAAFGAFPRRSLAGEAGLGTSLAANATEENSFFGVPLLILAAACFVVLWRHARAGRRATLRALAITAVVFTVLSWGPRARWRGTVTDTPLPYAPLTDVPIFNAALPSRLALIVTPIVGLLLAFAVDLLRTSAPRPRPVRAAWALCFAAALLPLLPATLLTGEREPVPAFITSGTWREYVSPGGVLAPIPFTTDLLPDGQRWQAYALAHRQGEFAIPSGFFLGPGGPDGRGRVGPVPRDTDRLLFEVAKTGDVPRLTNADRVAARRDFHYWRAEVAVLPDQVHGSKFAVHEDALLRTMTELLGPPERVRDVWLWQLPTG